MIVKYRQHHPWKVNPDGSLLTDIVGEVVGWVVKPANGGQYTHAVIRTGSTFIDAPIFRLTVIDPGESDEVS